MKPSPLALPLCLVLMALTVISVLCVPLPQRTRLDEQFAKVCVDSSCGRCGRASYRGTPGGVDLSRVDTVCFSVELSEELFQLERGKRVGGATCGRPSEAEAEADAEVLWTGDDGGCGSRHPGDDEEASLRGPR